MFRRAEREPFVFEYPSLKTIAIVTDGSADDALAHKTAACEFASVLEDVGNWQFVSGADFSKISELLATLEELEPDLIITHRHVREQSQELANTLGAYVDVLTQIAPAPVLLLPGTKKEPVSLGGEKCREVMVITDHISGDSRLVNFGVKMASPDGKAWLCHIEDDAVFERYMNVIARIPGIDSESARAEIDAQLTADAQNFIDGCIDVLKQEAASIEMHSVVERGSRLQEYMRLVDNHEIDLVVVNTRVDDQLAMRGMAYSLAVEMINTALLLL